MLEVEDLMQKKSLSCLERKTNDISIVFFDCDNLNLINRFKENRRTHPLKLDLPVMISSTENVYG